MCGTSTTSTHNRCTPDRQIPKAKKTGKIADLTFGEYRFLIDKGINWRCIEWAGLPREQFVHRLNRVRLIRSEIAHFQPDPLAATSLATPEEYAGPLRQHVP
ncbi:hypothetical protein LV75_005178 [Actinokineospora diospyrosa]|uniref:Uncharacterized protein n=2 Tax=Actinokineospora diospyrosa TaxID=103728 RepID=A0ABT1IJ25_9PSEU|nr:hypothetical protein [Actinokineospora diospyrosa]